MRTEVIDGKVIITRTIAPFDGLTAARNMVFRSYTLGWSSIAKVLSTSNREVVDQWVDKQIMFAFEILANFIDGYEPHKNLEGFVRKIQYIDEEVELSLISVYEAPLPETEELRRQMAKMITQYWLKARAAAREFPQSIKP
jgi:hypothetical protein